MFSVFYRFLKAQEAEPDDRSQLTLIMTNGSTQNGETNQLTIYARGRCCLGKPSQVAGKRVGTYLAIGMQKKIKVEVKYTNLEV